MTSILVISCLVCVGTGESAVAAPPAEGSADEPSAREAPADVPWYERSLVGLEVGPTGAQFGHSDPDDVTYCKRFHGGDIVRACRHAGSEYLVMWARDGDYAYYNSHLLPKAPGLAGRDPLREAMDAATEVEPRLPVIAYCVVQQGGHFLKAHPEWEMRGSDGRRIGRFCFNSGYLTAMKQIVAEQLAYGIDGFHIDMLDQGFGPPYGCWCDSCQTLFEREFGHPMPEGPTWDAAWDDVLEFRYATSERFERELTDHIRSIRPTATVDYNYHGNPPFSFEVGQRPVQHARNGDFVTGETGVWGFSALGVSLNAAFYRAATPGQPFQVAMQRGVRMYHDQTTRPVNDLRWELLTLLSHGAFVTIVDKTAFDGTLDPEAYDRFRDCFDEVHRKAEHFGHTPVADVGICFSSRTRDWVGREQPGEYFRSFQGAHRACVLEHIPFGVVLDEDLSLKSLRQFPVVVLPNASVLSDTEVETLTAWVRGGGNLIVTGDSGQRDRFGKPQGRSALAELMGATVVRRIDAVDNWMRFPAVPVPGEPAPGEPGDGGAASAAGDIAESIRPNWHFLVKGPATVYAPTTAAAIGELMTAHRTLRQIQGRMGTEWPMSAGAVAGPAVLLNSVGRGRVLTLAGSPDFATASEHPVVEARTLLGNAVRFLHPDPRVRISAPAYVEAVVTDDPQARKLRVHCIARVPTPRGTPSQNRPRIIPGLIEDVPIFRVTIAVRDGVSHVTAANPVTKIERDGSVIRATIEDIHEVIVIEY